MSRISKNVLSDMKSLQSAAGIVCSTGTVIPVAPSVPVVIAAAEATLTAEPTGHSAAVNLLASKHPGEHHGESIRLFCL